MLVTTAFRNHTASQEVWECPVGFIQSHQGILLATTEQDLCSWLCWGYRGVGRMDSRGFWHGGRQWHQLILFVSLQVKEVFQFHVISHQSKF